MAEEVPVPITLASDRDAAVRALIAGLASFERLHTVLESLPAGLLLADLSGHIVAANSLAQQILGLSASGEDLDLYLEYPARHSATKEPITDRDRPLRLALEREQTSISVPMDVTLPDASTRSILVSAAPLRDLQGVHTGAIAMILDITEERRRVRQSDALNEIYKVLQPQRPADTAIRTVLAVAAEATGAEWAAMFVREDDQWIARWTHGMRSFAGARSAPDHTFMVTPDEDPESADVDVATHTVDPRLRRRGIMTAMDAPVVIGEDLPGRLVLYHRREDAFDEVDADFLRKVVATLTLALRMSARSERQRTISRRIQQALQVVPSELPGVRIAHLYRSATRAALVGGDFYDAFLIDEGVAGLMIGDISGKGIEAAAASVTARGVIRSAAYDGLEPGACLRRLQQLHLRDMPEHFFVTVFFARLELDTGRLLYSSAGHPPPLVRREPSGGTLQVLSLPPTAPLLAGLGLGQPPQAEARLTAGDVLLLYTDGVIETRDDRGELYGDERLRRQLARRAPLASLPRRILSDVRHFSGGKMSDDMAVLAVGWEGPQGDPSCLDGPACG